MAIETHLHTPVQQRNVFFCVSLNVVSGQPVGQARREQNNRAVVPPRDFPPRRPSPCPVALLFRAFATALGCQPRLPRPTWMGSGTGNHAISYPHRVPSSSNPLTAPAEPVLWQPTGLRSPPHPFPFPLPTRRTDTHWNDDPTRSHCACAGPQQVRQPAAKPSELP